MNHVETLPSGRPFVTLLCSATSSAMSSALKLAETPALARLDGGFVTPLRPRRALGVVCDFVGADQAVRINTNWVALSVVVLALGLLLVASQEDSLFSNRSAPPGTNVSAEPTAPSLTTPTSPSTSLASTAAAPTATPTPLPSEPLAPPPAPTAVTPSTAPPATPPAATAAAPAAPTPTAVASEQPASPPAPTAAGPSAPAPPAPTTVAPSGPSAAALPAATAAAPQPPSVLPAEAKMSAADRRQVQEALQRLDYYKGPVDAIFGPLTHAAIRRFQQSIGSDTTGYLTADQGNRLVTPR